MHRRRIQAVTAALASLALAGCGGQSDDTAPEGDFMQVVAALVRAAAEGIDPNGIGDSPLGPNGLGRPASGADENGVGAPPALVARGAGAGAENQAGGGDGAEGEDGATSTSSSGGFVPNGLGEPPDEPSGVGAPPGQSGASGGAGPVDCDAFCAFAGQCVGALGGTFDAAECAAECEESVATDRESDALARCFLNALSASSCADLVICARAAGEASSGDGDDTGPTSETPSVPQASCAAACQVLSGCIEISVGECVPSCEADGTLSVVECVVDAAGDCDAAVACIQ